MNQYGSPQVVAQAGNVKRGDEIMRRPSRSDLFDWSNVQCSDSCYSLTVNLHAGVNGQTWAAAAQVFASVKGLSIAFQMRNRVKRSQSRSGTFMHVSQRLYHWFQSYKVSDWLEGFMLTRSMVTNDQHICCHGWHARI